MQQVRDAEHIRVAEHLLNLHVEVNADQASFVVAVDVGNLLLEPPVLAFQNKAAQYFSKSVDVVHDVVRVVVFRFQGTCQGPCVFQACEPRLENAWAFSITKVGKRLRTKVANQACEPSPGLLDHRRLPCTAACAWQWQPAASRACATISGWGNPTSNGVSIFGWGNPAVNGYATIADELTEKADFGKPGQTSHLHSVSNQGLSALTS